MPWGKDQITRQALRTASEDYAAFEAVGLGAREGVRVLDVGCFDGFNTVLKFAPYASVARVVGIDPSEKDIAEAAARTGDPRFAFRCAGFEDFEPEPGEQFDLVYFSHVLQHLPDAQAALDKAFCLLAPGGFTVVKTVDDGAKLSYPDPDDVMRRLLGLYDAHVRPNTPWTARTDRCNGRKCYTLMRRAGFGNVQVRTFSADTAGKTLEERRALFERCVYFRRNVPPCVDSAVADEIRRLVEAWGALFEQDDYYFSSESFVAVGQKLGPGAKPQAYAGPVFGGAGAPPEAGAAAGAAAVAGAGAGLLVRAMEERDLGEVMSIEIASFHDPWTPLAFALDLRHNPRARYAVAVDASGAVAGYLGWWDTPEGAAIVRVATAAHARRTGVGAALVSWAEAGARDAGQQGLVLEVRAANAGARAFYRRMGFEEAGVRAGYYDDPADDAVTMCKPLSQGGPQGAEGVFCT